jgi:hypothetical protein
MTWLKVLAIISINIIFVILIPNMVIADDEDLKLAKQTGQSFRWDKGTSTLSQIFSRV